METKDLRIGNYVFINKNTKGKLNNNNPCVDLKTSEGKCFNVLGKILGITEDGVIISIGRKHYYLVDHLETDIHSILITKNLLKELDFEVACIDKEGEVIIENMYVRHFKDFEISISFIDREKIRVEVDNKEVNLKYLHQLQNLVFALTGEELTLNKTK